MEHEAPDLLTCRLCGQAHVAVPLRVAERALCVQCGTALAHGRFHRDAAPAFTLTALLLSIPALQLPLVHVDKFGSPHPSWLWSGVRSLWSNGMPLLSVWVALCGTLVPLALIGALTGCVAAPRIGRRAAHRWVRAARAFQHWSMPEVHVLAILVAFVKIGVLVDVRPGLGLWFYSGMAVMTLLAWRSLELEEYP